MKMQKAEGRRQKSRSSRGEGNSSFCLDTSAFSLLEVMIALAIFFMALFSILALISNTLRNARALQVIEPDAGMLAGQLSLTNKLFVGSESGDFGDDFPGYSWTREVTEAGTNGFFKVDFIVSHRVGRQEVESYLSTLFYRPESPSGQVGSRFAR
jgi:hypothetical protein